MVDPPARAAGSTAARSQTRVGNGLDGPGTRPAGVPAVTPVRPKPRTTQHPQPNHQDLPQQGSIPDQGAEFATEHFERALLEALRSAARRQGIEV